MAPSVCLSVTSQCSIETAEWIQLTPSTRLQATLGGLSYTVLEGNSGISKIRLQLKDDPRKR